MREAESKYWDGVCESRNGLHDNIWKRCAIVSRILAHRPANARILEIGAGQMLAAAVTNLVTLGNIQYTGTDVSAKFCEYGKRWQLKMVQTDILKLPDGPFDMVWAFDSLEHVRPEDREPGYQEIDRVLARPGVILLNLPVEETQHDLEFDHGIDISDVVALSKATGAEVVKWEPYAIEEISRRYVWAELQR